VKTWFRRDDGSFTLFAAVIVPALLLLIGLGVDGGNGFQQAQRADSYAAEAARAGAQAINQADLLAGRPLSVDPQAATDAANAYLAKAGVAGTVQVDPVKRVITVDVTVNYPTQILFAIGIDTMPVHGHASAVLLHGITAPEAQ
jgi:Flp pilus assembly protein TadG